MKTEYLDKTYQEERQNTWIEHPKKKDRIPVENIPRRKTEYLDGTTSQEERHNTWMEHPKKKDTEYLDRTS